MFWIMSFHFAYVISSQKSASSAALIHFLDVSYFERLKRDLDTSPGPGILIPISVSHADPLVLIIAHDRIALNQSVDETLLRLRCFLRHFGAPLAFVPGFDGAMVTLRRFGRLPA
jgi:hypothetical protein